MSAKSFVIGTNAFGNTINADDAMKIIKESERYHDNNIIEIDSAWFYCAGKSEQLLSMYSNDDNIKISTKVTAWKLLNDKCGLDRSGILFQFNESLKRLKMDKVDILYIHHRSADFNTNDILETLMTVNELYLTNKFERFGICNYAAWEVAYMINLCDKYNLVKPTIYQGRYNIFRREIENELLPCLRFFNIAFYAFSPTARGLITNKHKYIDKQNNSIKNGKFGGKFGVLNQKGYWHKSFFDGLQHIIDNIDTTNMNETELRHKLLEYNFSYLMYHSKLDESKGDKIILGGSKYEHFNESINAMSNAKPLNNKILNVFENVWKMSKKECLNYYGTIERRNRLINAKL